MLTVLYVILGISIVLLMVPIGLFLEKRYFNDGICPNCGEKLKYLYEDSQGSRGYHCENCHYRTWVSFNAVDKNFKEVRGDD